jgi:hypothetical protein
MASVYALLVRRGFDARYLDECTMLDIELLLEAVKEHPDPPPI